MRIIILGAGVQGTIYAVRLARCGHNVTLVARFVRREQIDAVLPDLSAAAAIERIVFMYNHANGSDLLLSMAWRDKVVIGFPSAAGSIENGVDVYLDVAEQPTVIARNAGDIAAILAKAGFRVQPVTDMDSWLKRHAIFVTAVGGALYRKNCDVKLLASDKKLVRAVILGVREGWASLDRLGVGAAPLALRAIFSWVPMLFAVRYWCRLFGSSRGEYYFARHTKRSVAEMKALAQDVRALVAGDEMPHLRFLYESIDAALTTFSV